MTPEDKLRMELVEQAIELERQERNQMIDNGIERRKNCECKHEASIHALKQSETSMQKSIDSVSAKLDLILAQITKVAVLEEKHSNQSADVNRAHKYIQDLETKQRGDMKDMEKALESLALETRAFINQAKGMWAVIAFIGAGGLLTLAKVFFWTH